MRTRLGSTANLIVAPLFTTATFANDQVIYLFYLLDVRAQGFAENRFVRLEPPR